MLAADIARLDSGANPVFGEAGILWVLRAFHRVELFAALIGSPYAVGRELDDLIHGFHSNFGIDDAP